MLGHSFGQSIVPATAAGKEFLPAAAGNNGRTPADILEWR
jgi:hypothetical protein